MSNTNPITFWLMEEKPDKTRRRRACLGCGEAQEYLIKEPAPSYVAWYKAHLACRELYSPTETTSPSDNFTGKEHLPHQFFPGDRVEVEVDGKWLPGIYEKPDSAWGDMQKVLVDGNDQVTMHSKRDVRPLAHMPKETENMPKNTENIGTSAVPTDAIGTSSTPAAYPKEWDGWNVGDMCEVRSTAGSGWADGIVTRMAPKLKVQKCGGKTEFSPFDIRRIVEVPHIEDIQPIEDIDPVEGADPVEDAIQGSLPECPKCGFVGVYLTPTGKCMDCSGIPVDEQDDLEEQQLKADQEAAESAIPYPVTPDDTPPAPIWMLSPEEFTPHRLNAEGQWRTAEGAFNQAGMEAWRQHRFAVLQAINSGEDVPEKAVTAHRESFLSRQWQHVQDVRAGLPAVWGGHWEIEVPVGPDGEIARVISHADDLSVKSAIGVIS